jgi:hypothetical protein
MSNVRPHQQMPVLRIVLAAVLGALLHYVAVVYLGGVLAAIGIPRAYFAFFGRERTELALALLNLVVWALPVFVAVFLGALVALRVLHGTLRSSAWALALGMLGAFVYWQVSLVVLVPSESSSMLSFGQAFISTLFSPWWVAPNLVAPWVGLALAVLLASTRFQGSAPREV